MVHVFAVNMLHKQQFFTHIVNVEESHLTCVVAFGKQF